jgi:hypothetical protein
MAPVVGLVLFCFECFHLKDNHGTARGIELSLKQNANGDQRYFRS